MKTRQLMIGAVTLALALAPTAQAEGVHPDSRPLARGYTEAAPLGPDDRALPRQIRVDSVSPDDRAFSRASVPAATAGSTHPDDRALSRATVRPEPVTFVRGTEGGLDWTDFWVGAAGGFGMALLIGGATLIARRSGYRQPRPA